MSRSISVNAHLIAAICAVGGSPCWFVSVACSSSITDVIARLCFCSASVIQSPPFSRHLDPKPRHTDWRPVVCSLAFSGGSPRILNPRTVLLVQHFSSSAPRLTRARACFFRSAFSCVSRSISAKASLIASTSTLANSHATGRSAIRLSSNISFFCFFVIISAPIYLILYQSNTHFQQRIVCNFRHFLTCRFFRLLNTRSEPFCAVMIGLRSLAVMLHHCIT